MNLLNLVAIATCNDDQAFAVVSSSAVHAPVRKFISNRPSPTFLR
jgi:hypothetical protein